MGNESTKETNENLTPAKSTTKEVTQTPEQDYIADKNNKSVSKEILLQRRISARTQAHAEKEKDDNKQKEVSFAVEPPDTGEKQQEK
eukprot:9607179-Ditylum_brightwellii.AAC.1